MEPRSRIAFNYPIYALDLLGENAVAVAGGGGVMKSGVPNQCAVLNLDEGSGTLTETVSVDLSDAAVAMASSGATLHTVIGPGIKNFSYTRKKLTPHSSFHHDLRVSSTQEQAAIAVSKDGTILVIASDDGHVISLQLPRYEQLINVRLHTQGVTDLSIMDDGSMAATTGRDRAAYIWHTSTGDIVQTIKPVMPPAYRTHVRAIRFCETKPRLLFTAESNPRKGGWIAAWERTTPSHAANFGPVASLKASMDALTAVAVNRSGSLIAVSSSEGHVALLRWNGSSFSCAWTTETKVDWFSAPEPPHVLPVTGMRFSMSGEHLLTASADYTVAVWPVQRKRSWRSLKRLAFLLVSFAVAIFAVLVAEEDHLHHAIRQRRTRLQPYFEPHASHLQHSVRPFLRRRQAELQPYLREIGRITRPYIEKMLDRSGPHTEADNRPRPRRHPVVEIGGFTPPGGVKQHAPVDEGSPRDNRRSYLPEALAEGDSCEVPLIIKRDLPFFETCTVEGRDDSGNQPNDEKASSLSTEEEQSLSSRQTFDLDEVDKSQETSPTDLLPDIVKYVKEEMEDVNGKGTVSDVTQDLPESDEEAENEPPLIPTSRPLENDAASHNAARADAVAGVPESLYEKVIVKAAELEDTPLQGDGQGRPGSHGESSENPVANVGASLLEETSRGVEGIQLPASSLQPQTPLLEEREQEGNNHRVSQETQSSLSLEPIATETARNEGILLERPMTVPKSPRTASATSAALLPDIGMSEISEEAAAESPDIVTPAGEPSALTQPESREEHFLDDEAIRTPETERPGHGASEKNVQTQEGPSPVDSSSEEHAMVSQEPKQDKISSMLGSRAEDDLAGRSEDADAKPDGSTAEGERQDFASKVSGSTHVTQDSTSDAHEGGANEWAGLNSLLGEVESLKEGINEVEVGNIARHDLSFTEPEDVKVGGDMAVIRKEARETEGMLFADEDSARDVATPAAEPASTIYGGGLSEATTEAREREKMLDLEKPTSKDGNGEPLQTASGKSKSGVHPEDSASAYDTGSDDERSMTLAPTEADGMLVTEGRVEGHAVAQDMNTMDAIGSSETIGDTGGGSATS